MAQELERRLLVPHVQRMGELLQQLLADLVSRRPQQLEGVRGWGLLQGLVLRSDGPAASDVVLKAIEAGLLVVAAGPRVVRFVPPLVIQPRQLKLAVSRLEQALQAIATA